jgi:hypothetical protein
VCIVPPRTGVQSWRNPLWKEGAMTSSATRLGIDHTVAEREAWAAYRESLRDLEGSDYEEAERVSWERLQRALLELRAMAPDE